MLNLSHKRRLADLLEKVVEGSIDTAEALREVADWPDTATEHRGINLALTALVQAHKYREVCATNSEFDEDMKHRLRLEIVRLRT